MANEYWLNRAVENDARNERSKNDGIEKIRKAFVSAEDTLLERIEAFYSKYNVDGVIDPADARKRLTPAELTAFRKQISKLARTATSDSEKEYLSQLRRRMYISRQEALLAEIRHHAVELGVQTEGVIGDTLQKIYAEQESHQHYNIEQDMGWGVDFEGLAPSQIQSLIHQGYSGDDFSPRVWRNTEQLVKHLNVLLPQQFLLGRSTQDLARELSKAMNTPRYSAEATIRTEGSNVAAQADMHVYKQADVETYEFMATLDDRTSEICQSLDGMHFNVKDAQAGVNLPPMHVSCRSTTLPDVDMEGYDETRLAKDEDGQYIVVPKQTYSQWKASLATRSAAAASLTGAMVSWRDFRGLTSREALLAKANQLITGEIPEDVFQARNDPELLKKIRANAQTTFNENSSRYLKAAQQYDQLANENSAEALKLKAEMDRYANKMVLYANKLQAIGYVSGQPVQATPTPVQRRDNIFKATTVDAMRQEFEQTYSVKVSTLADSEVELAYEAVARMYAVEPEMTLAGLKRMPSISYFSDKDSTANPNTYAWVYKQSQRMQLNRKWFNDYAAFEKSYASDVAVRWHPKNGDVYSLFVHEFGHVVDGTYFGSPQSTYVANAIERAWNKAKKTGQYFDKTEWKESISRYASHNNAETIAEAWTDWIDNGNNASEASKLIIEEFRKEIAKNGR